MSEKIKKKSLIMYLAFLKTLEINVDKKKISRALGRSPAYFQQLSSAKTHFANVPEEVVDYLDANFTPTFTDYLRDTDEAGNIKSDYAKILERLEALEKAKDQELKLQQQILEKQNDIIKHLKK